MASLLCSAAALVIVLCIHSGMRAGTQGSSRNEITRTENAKVLKSKVNRKVKKVSFTFTRSGGVAGKATAIRASVTLEPNGGSVSAPEKAGYHRVLTAEEAAKLKSWLLEAERQPTQNKATPSSVPDSFQYNIVTGTGQGTHTLELSSPSNAALEQWVENECGKIWNHMIASRKSNP
jgi:hypothetical protein